MSGEIDMIVENRLEWNERNNLVELLIEEKRKKLKDLKLEIFTLNFALEYWKSNPFD